MQGSLKTSGSPRESIRSRKRKNNRAGQWPLKGPSPMPRIAAANSPNKERQCGAKAQGSMEAGRAHDRTGSREHEIEQMAVQHSWKADLEGGEPTTPIFP